MGAASAFARFLGLNSDEAAKAASRTLGRGAATGGAVLATGAGAAGALWLGGQGLRSFTDNVGDGINDFSHDVGEAFKPLIVPGAVVVGLVVVASMLKRKGARASA